MGQLAALLQSAGDVDGEAGDEAEVGGGGGEEADH
jgi:hypothetical protein